MIHLPTVKIEKNPQSPFMTKRTIMNDVGVGLSTVNKWLYEGGLKHYKVDRKVFIKTSDFYEWFENFKLEKGSGND